MAPLIRLPRQRGAALLLMLAVLGLSVASLLMTRYGRIDLRGGPEKRSAAALQEAREALLGYAVTNGRLPRPARDGAGSEHTGDCLDDAACTGFLPWKTLGIAPGDGWGKLLRYSVTPVLTVAPVQTTVAFGTKSVRTRAGATLDYLAGSAQCSLGTRCAAAVVLSHGRDRGGTSLAGVARADAVQAAGDEAANLAGASDFVQRALDDDARAPGGAFDDQLAWISLDLLLNRMSRARVLPRGD